LHDAAQQRHQRIDLRGREGVCPSPSLTRSMPMGRALYVDTWWATCCSGTLARTVPSRSIIQCTPRRGWASICRRLSASAPAGTQIGRPCASQVGPPVAWITTMSTGWVRAGPVARALEG